MNTENSKTNGFNKFIYQFTDKVNLKNPNNKNIGLVNLSVYCTWKNIKSTYNKNKISAPTWNDKFDCLVDHIQSQTFKIILSTLSKNMRLQKIVFKTKTGYKIELLSPEKMKLLGSAKKDVDKDGEDVPKLEFVEVVLVHCNLVIK